MEKEKYIKPLIDVILLDDDIIATSQTWIDPDSGGGSEFDPDDPWA